MAQKQYVIKAGDTLTGIAIRECGASGDKVKSVAAQIAADNHIANPALIQIGQKLTLTIPDPVAPASPAPTNVVPPSSAPVPTTAPVTPVVTPAPAPMSTPVTPATSTAAITEGIDVSHFQLGIDWARVKKSGKVFAFTKATDGLTWVDPNFLANWPAMKAAGIIRGSYHYFRADKDPVQQANFFLQTVKPEASDLPPVVDVERTFNDKVDAVTFAQGIQTWLTTVQQALGRMPIVYTNLEVGNAILKGSVARYPLWIAAYVDVSKVSRPFMPQGWQDWTFWQYTDQGNVDGITKHVDLTRFQGSADQLAAFIAGR